MSRDELHQVGQTLGRFYGQLSAPSKRDQLEYAQSLRTLSLLLDADANQRLNVADLTIAEVQARVESGDLDRARALEGERDGKARKTLIDWLEAE